MPSFSCYLQSVIWVLVGIALVMNTVIGFCRFMDDDRDLQAYSGLLIMVFFVSAFLVSIVHVVAVELCGMAQ